MKKYFIVKVKCGHVGRNNYIPMDFPVNAENAKEAAAIAREKPGVKRNHSNAILCVREVEREEFYRAARAVKEDIYWSIPANICRSLFLSRMVPETPHRVVHRLAISQKDFEKSNRIATRGFRRRKYCQYEQFLRDDIAKEYGISI